MGILNILIGLLGDAHVIRFQLHSRVFASDQSLMNQKVEF